MWYPKTPIIPTQNLVIVVAANTFTDASQKSVEDAVGDLSAKYAQQ
jgi:hypothetical protein